MKQYDYAVYIGRMQPPHMGHILNIQTALNQAKHVIVIIGSANTSRDIKNPFNDNERVEMLRRALSDQENKRTFIAFSEDRLYQNHLWVAETQSIVESIINTNNDADNSNVTIVGYEKDDSSWYLNSFKQWDFITTPVFTNTHHKSTNQMESINSTQIREMIYKGQLGYIQSVVPSSVFHYLQDFTASNIYNELVAEYRAAIEEEKQYQSIPNDYAINFLTTDAVVIQSGHVLMVKRGSRPGKGQWALPGGHVGANETARESSIRELTEETGIKVPEKVLFGSIRDSQFFDHPDRSLRCRVTEKRGRTVSMAYLISLDDREKLPKIRKPHEDSSDAEYPWWIPLGDLHKLRNEMFEDHYDIISYFISTYDIGH